jgi:hypothetical protein
MIWIVLKVPETYITFSAQYAPDFISFVTMIRVPAIFTGVFGTTNCA